MAKSIKFNLILDEYPVRNLEGLQEHFSIEDMLKYFRNGLLERWLKVRGYETEFAAVQEISPDDDNMSIIKRFVEIFKIPINGEDVEKGIAVLDYIDENNFLNQEYRKNAFEKHRIINDYHQGYEELIRRMEGHRDEMAFLRADVIELEREYLGLFILDYKALYYRISKSAPKAVFVMLTRDAFRKYWFNEWVDRFICSEIKKELLSDSKMRQALGENLKIFQGTGQGADMWVPVAVPEIEVMVLKVTNNLYVRNAGEYTEKWSYQDVNEKFQIFQGLEFCQCDRGDYQIFYVEV